MKIVFKKGATIPELMIVLLLISTAMVISVSVLVSSSIQLRNNQISNATNTKLVGVIETLKTTGNISFQGNNGIPLQANLPYYYKIFNSDDFSLGLEYMDNGLDKEVDICTVDSSYYITPTSLGVSSVIPICIQVEITRLVENVDEFKLKAMSVYYINAKPIFKEFIGYRYSNFNNGGNL